MSKLTITVFLLAILSAGVAALDGTALLERVDALVSYPEADFQARYTIVQDKPAQGRITTVASVFRRDGEETYTIVIEQPLENRGQGYLKKGETLWVYDPESRQFNSTGSTERFQNTNARNSDFTRSTLARDYRVVSSTEADLGRYRCTLLDLEAQVDGLSYPKMKIWIDQDYLVRKTEDFSLSGRLLRTSIFPSYHELGDRYVLNKVLYVDHLEGALIEGKFVNEKTQITIESPSLTSLPDSVFSKSFLERISR